MFVYCDFLYYQLLLIIAIGEASVNVQYIHKYSYSQTVSGTYLFYYCDVEGATLQWEVNHSPLGGFINGQAGMVQKSTRSNFNYTTLLLTSLDINDTMYFFESMLIVSAASSTPLEVVCISDIDLNTTNNFGAPVQREMYESVLNSERNVILNHLFSKEETARNNSHFSLFLCSVQQDFQAWELNNNGLPFGFSILDNEDRVIPSPFQGKMSVNMVAFLAFNVEYVLSTFLLLQGMPNVNISCASGLYSVEVYVVNERDAYTTEFTVHLPTNPVSVHYNNTETEIASQSKSSIIFISVLILHTIYILDI